MRRRVGTDHSITSAAAGAAARARILRRACGDRESLWLESGTKGVMGGLGGLGFYPQVVERPRNKLEAIAAARCAARC